MTPQGGRPKAAPANDIDGDNPFRLLVEAVTDYAIYMLDPEGHVASWNSGAQRFKAYTASEIIGRHFSEFYTPEDQDAGLPARVLETAEREGKFEGEGWRVRKDGGRFWAHVVIDPIRDRSGRLLGFAKITRDLTERKAAEETLRAAQEDFELLVQSVTDYAIYRLDPAGHVATWNAGARRIKGYAPEEIVGQHFSRFYTEEDRAAGMPAVALATAEREGRFEKEGWRVRKDGTRFLASVVIDPIRGPDGVLRGFAKITRDITERKDNERKLEQAREALFQSQKMEALGQLTGGVAHDFNNLLSAIIGSLELVQRRLAPEPRTQRLIGNALEAAQRGASLTQRMLAFARRQDLDAEPTDIRLLLAGMADLLDRTLGSGIDVSIRHSPSIKPVLVDRNQLEMAVLNLAVNARDAMPHGGPLILEAREEGLAEDNRLALPPGRYVVLSVIDRGSGMDEETLKHAIEPFYTTKGIGKGTGLGLSMVHGMAEQLRGRLQLESKPGVGTTASLWIPVTQETARAAGAPADAPAPAPADLQALDILAVDDDVLVLTNTAAMLEDRGHRVNVAYSAREALDLLKRRSFDLLVTDQGMPGMTGAELIAIAQKDYPDMAIVLATGYAELPAGMAVGVPRVNKPFLQDHLLQGVRAALEHKGSPPPK
jgi:PAS domain S-box-containing protein